MPFATVVLQAPSIGKANSSGMEFTFANPGWYNVRVQVAQVEGTGSAKSMWIRILINGVVVDQGYASSNEAFYPVQAQLMTRLRVERDDVMAVEVKTDIASETAEPPDKATSLLIYDNID